MIKNVVITYQVNMGQEEVKDALIVMGYSDKKYSHTRATQVRLPKNCLWKAAEDLSTTTVLHEVNTAVAKLNKTKITKGKIILDKAIAVAFTQWSALDIP
jgi:hypothetical protein